MSTEETPEHPILSQLQARPLLWETVIGDKRWKSVLCNGDNVEVYEYCSGRAGEGEYWLSGDPFISHHDFPTREAAFAYAQSKEQEAFIDWIREHIDRRTNAAAVIDDIPLVVTATIRAVYNRNTMRFDELELTTIRQP